MENIDFGKIKEPFTFIKELLPNATEQEILEAHIQYTEFLNALWKIHQSQLADKQICDKVKDR